MPVKDKDYLEMNRGLPLKLSIVRVLCVLLQMERNAWYVLEYAEGRTAVRPYIASESRKLNRAEWPENKKEDVDQTID